MPRAKYKKRADGRYAAQVYLGKDAGGKRCYRTFYGKTIAALEEKVLEFKQEKTQTQKRERAPEQVHGRERFLVWAERLLEMKQHSVSRSQIHLYAARLSYFTEVLGNEPLCEVSLFQLQEIVDELARKNPATGNPTAKRTLLSVQQIVRQVFQFAMDLGCLDRNPAQLLQIPRDAPKSQRTGITKQQIRWIEETPHRAQLPAMIMLYAGLRRGEVTALLWSDIDLQARTIQVTKSMDDKEEAIKAPKTESGIRVVYIPEKLVKFLERQPQEHASEHDLRHDLGHNLGNSVENSLGNSLEHDLRNSLGNSLENSLEHDLRHDLRHDLGSDLRNSLGHNLRNSLGHNLRNNLGHNLRNNLGSDLRHDLGSDLRHDLRNSLRHDLGHNLRNSLGNNLRSDLRHDLEHDLRHDLRHDLGNSLGNSLEHDLRHDLGNNLRSDLGHDLRNSLVVTSAHGKIMTHSAWTKLWASYQRELQKTEGQTERFTAHQLRHTYCTMLNEAGVDALTAMRQMGHSDIKTTLGVYTHLDQEHQKQEFQKLELFLRSSSI